MRKAADQALLNADSPNNNKMHPSGEVGRCKMNIRLRRRMIFDVIPLESRTYV